MTYERCIPDVSRARVLQRSAREQFCALPAAEQVAGIAGLARAGHSVPTIAHATGLSVEAIQRLLGAPADRTPEAA
jgi:hypothetical protein